MRNFKFALLPVAMAMVVAPMVSSCNDDDDDSLEQVAAWQQANEKWLAAQAARLNDDGTPYYTRLTAPWNRDAYVLIHYFNDRSLTAGNLSPLFTSTIDVRYQLYNHLGERVDSSLNVNTYGPGVARFPVYNTITGWAIAFDDIRVGDSCEIVVPYEQAYGTTATAAIPAYSNLRFNVRLVDIPYYEIRN